jgi:von Willebrand factor A domain-containing protein 7
LRFLYQGLSRRRKNDTSHEIHPINVGEILAAHASVTVDLFTSLSTELSPLEASTSDTCTIVAMRSASLRHFRIYPWVVALLGMGFFCPFVSSVVGQTQSSANPSRSFDPDACGPADPTYIHTANETGGIPMFLQRSEAAKAFHLVRESTRNNVATVLWATGTLDGKAQTFEVPVDSVTKRITFSFSVDTKGTKLSLTQPSGGAIVRASASTEITELNCGRIVTVITPEEGSWQAEITGSGRFWIEAQAQSDIYFISAEFVKNGGRPGHEGLFRIPGQPLAGIPATLEVSLSAKAAQITEFRLVTERGDTIQELRMNGTSSDREFLEFVGDFQPPKQPFRVAVIGHDTNGRTYQRFFSTLFHAETVEVLPGNGLDELSAGNTKQLTFTLRNSGPPAKFKITVTDARRFVSQVAPQELALGTGESGTVQVDLTVPKGTAPGIGDDVIVVATSTVGPASSNSSVVHLSVSSTASH